MTDQTLQQLLVERVSAYALSDRPRELIDEGIDKLFKEVASDTFRSYGDFGKAIKEAISAALPANVSDAFELQRYNSIIASALRERWETAAVHTAIIEQADRSIAEVLDGNGLVTGELRLSELMKAFVEEHKEKATDEQWERPEIRIEEGDGYGLGSRFIHIYFDEEPEPQAYSSRRRSVHELSHSIHVMVKGERETKEHWRKSEAFGEVYSAKLDDKKVSINMSIRSDWERMVASLYFGNALLIIDCDPDDVSYGIYD